MLAALRIQNTVEVTTFEGVSDTAYAMVHTESLPGISISKVARQSTYSAAGETIIYDIVVTNTGNITLNSVEVVDLVGGVRLTHQLP